MTDSTTYSKLNYSTRPHTCQSGIPHILKEEYLVISFHLSLQRGFVIPPIKIEGPIKWIFIGPFSEDRLF